MKNDAAICRVFHDSVGEITQRIGKADTALNHAGLNIDRRVSHDHLVCSPTDNIKNTLITNMIRIEGSIRTYGNDFSPSNGFIWQLFIRPQSGDCFSV
ncbi:hypothetical protein AAY85_06675 [Pseudomonas amygdali pv. lachrymans]|nr:hypothetical protein AAY85_06675 [Pseudomonas amygdali pv. lachrymans]RMV50061.1 hypothetical protein ALP09_104317 [Pseudomonas amygdali pv. lachrymans]